MKYKVESYEVIRKAKSQFENWIWFHIQRDNCPTTYDTVSSLPHDSQSWVSALSKSMHLHLDFANGPTLL